jgi:hypothetical protein
VGSYGDGGCGDSNAMKGKQRRRKDDASCDDLRCQVATSRTKHRLQPNVHHMLVHQYAHIKALHAQIARSGSTTKSRKGPYDGHYG